MSYRLNSQFYERQRHYQMCLFCFQQGHSLSSCNDSRIERFEVLCRSKKIDLLYSQNAFLNWINDFYTHSIDTEKRVIRYFAVKNCSTHLWTNVNNVFEKIMYYIFDLPFLEPPTEDFIPFSNNENHENDLFDSDVFETSFLNLNGRITTRSLTPPSIMVDEHFHLPPPRLSRQTAISARRIDITVKENETETFDCECAICLEGSENYVLLNCNHSFCEGCFERLLHSSSEISCPLCRSQTTSVVVKDEETKEKMKHRV